MRNMRRSKRCLSENFKAGGEITIPHLWRLEVENWSLKKLLEDWRIQQTIHWRYVKTIHRRKRNTQMNTTDKITAIRAYFNCPISCDCEMHTLNQTNIRRLKGVETNSWETIQKEIRVF